MKHGLFDDTLNKDTDPIYDATSEATYVDDNDNYQCYAIIDDSTGEECGILFAYASDSDDSTAMSDNTFDEISGSMIMGSEVIELCNKYKDSEYCIFITTRGYAPDAITYTTTAYNYCALADSYYPTSKKNMVEVGYRNGGYCIPNRIYSFGEVKHNNDFSPIYDESSEETYVAPNAKYKVMTVSDDKRKEICGLFCYRIDDTITWEPESAPDDSIDIDINEYLNNSANNPTTGDNVEDICKYKNSNYSIIVYTTYNNSLNADLSDLKLGYNFGTLLSTANSFESGEFYTADLTYDSTDNKFHDSKRKYGMTGRYSTNLMSNGEDSPLQSSDSFTYYILYDDYAEDDCGVVFVEN